jgi:ribosome maturation factor RimP
MMKQEWMPEIRDEAGRIAAGHGFEIVDALLKGAKPPKQLQIFIDRPGGITVGECALFSRELSEWIDQRFPDAQAHRLEVSSPGLDSILRTARDFGRNLGRNLVVEWSSGAKIRQTVGALRSANAETIEIDDGRETLEIPVASVVWAKIKLNW